MISIDQLAEIISRHSDRLGMPVGIEYARDKLLSGDEYGQFLSSFAQDIWQIGFDAAQPRKLTAKQKSELFNEVQRRGLGVMHAIENTERAIHADT